MVSKKNQLGFVNRFFVLKQKMLKYLCTGCPKRVKKTVEEGGGVDSTPQPPHNYLLITYFFYVLFSLDKNTLIIKS